MMKILSVHQKDYTYGGTERYFLSLGELLEKNGHQVIPFAARDPKNQSGIWREYFPEGSDFDRRNFHDITRFIYNREARKRMAEVIGLGKIDIAHLHTYYGKITSSILPELAKANIPVVQTLHDYKLVCPVYTRQRNGRECSDCSHGRFYNGILGKCNKGSLPRSMLSVAEMYVSRLLGSERGIAKFICVSNAQKKIHYEMGIPEEKLVVVHNFIDVTGYDPRFDVGDYLLYFGRIEEVKGVYTLIAAAKKLGLPLVMAGDGAELESIRERESALIKQGGLVLTGLLDGQRLVDVVKGASCVIIPSEWGETFGLVAAEAMASGKPVIASRIGGLPEVVDDGNTGYLFEPGNVVDLADKISLLLADKQIAMDMGKKGRKRVEDHFSPEAHYKKIMGIYRDVISRHAT